MPALVLQSEDYFLSPCLMPCMKYFIYALGTVSYLTHSFHKSLVKHRPVTGIDVGHKNKWMYPSPHGVATLSFDHSKCD